MDAPLSAIPEWLDLTAIAIGSGTATIVAGEMREKRLDWLGVSIVGITVGLGGGLIRDILIGIRPAAMENESYLLTAIIAALVGMLLQIAFQRISALISILDAAALAFFCAIGTAKAIQFGLPILPSIAVGAITAAGGGVIRDVLLNMPVGIMYVGSLYAFAAIAGASVYTVGVEFGLDARLGLLICAIITFAVRMASVWFGFSLPEQMSLRLPKRLAERQPVHDYSDAELLEATSLHSPGASPIENIKRRRRDQAQQRNAAADARKRFRWRPRRGHETDE